MTARQSLRDPAWRHFAAWCQARGLASLPAHPWTVAAYARTCEGRYPPAAIAGRVRAIARVHLLHGQAPSDRHPTVARTLAAIEAGRRRRRRDGGWFRAEDILSRSAAPPPAPAAPAAPNRGRRLRRAPPLVSRRPAPR